MKILCAGGLHLGEWETYRKQALDELNATGKIKQMFPKNHNGDWMCSQVLSDMGHEVIQFNYRFGSLTPFETLVKEDKLWEVYESFSSESALAKQDQAKMNQILLDIAETEKPDIFLTFLGDRIYPETIAKLQASNITTVFWHERNFIHDKNPNARESLCYYDFVFTYDPGFISILGDIGVPEVHYLPFGCYPPLHRKLAKSDFDFDYYKSDVTFCGTLMPGRVEFLHDIIDTGVKFWTHSWNEELQKRFPDLVPRYQGEARGILMVRLFNASKIILNEHHITSAITGTNMRTFEAGGCQTFQLSDYKPEIERMFKIGEEIVIYHDLADLKKKIAYYLEHPDEREEIARNLQKKVYAEHTYQHRFEEMFEIIKAA